jgi:hypothetical protein
MLFRICNPEADKRGFVIRNSLAFVLLRLKADCKSAIKKFGITNPEQPAWQQVCLLCALSDL